MGRVLFGIVLGFVFVFLLVLVWLYRGNLPVAVADPPLPYERQITSYALNQRIDRELIQMPPIQPEEQNYVAGARIYADKCAVCHGYHGKTSAVGENMYPSAPPLWDKHHNGPTVGVSDDPPGETYWKVANGIRLTGMPEFRTQLNDTQIWQVSILLANADKPLPPEALGILRDEPPPAASAPKTAAPKPATPPATNSQ